MRAFWKYCFIILVGCAAGWVLMMVLTSLDARGRFISPRFYLRAARSWHGATGRDWPDLDKMGVLRPARVEVERGVSTYFSIQGI